MNTSTPLIIVLLIGIVLQISSASETKANPLAKLDCDPGETQDFAYESDTSLWGPLNQNVKIKADVIVKCVGKEDTKNKYLVQILRVEPRIVRDKNEEITPEISAAHVTNVRTAEGRERERTGVAEWLKGAWKTIKEFFVGLFTSRRKSSEGDVTFDSSENSHKCRHGKAAPPTDHDWEEVSTRRNKRATNHKHLYDEIFMLPFEFTQSSGGKIVDILFSSKEKDENIKNFKKHVADTFATHLDPGKPKVMEESPIGEHMTRYEFDSTIGSSPTTTTLKTADSSLVKLVLNTFGKTGNDRNSLNVMRDILEEDIMRVGSPKEMIHDMNQVDIKVKQVQKISEGRVTATVGQLSVSLVNPDLNSSQRPKRSTTYETDGNSQLENIMKVNTQYSMKLRNRRNKRSPEEVKEEMARIQKMEQDLNFVSEPIVASSSQRVSDMERLESLRDHLAIILHKNPVSRQFFELKGGRSSWFPAMIEVLDLEYSLDEDRKSNSVSQAIRSSLSFRELEKSCGTHSRLNLKKCHDLLVIEAKAGSEDVLHLLINSIPSLRTFEEKTEALKIMTQINRPSDQIIQSLMKMYREEADDSLKGHLILTLTTLVSQPSVHPKMRTYAYAIMIQDLQRLKCNDVLLIDLLEAFGNLGDRSVPSKIIEKSSICSSEAHVVAAIHAVRKTVNEKPVKNWFMHLLVSPTTPCLIKQEVISTLAEAAARRSMTSSREEWPKYHFEPIDQYLFQAGLQTECFSQQLLQYFSRKRHASAQEFIKALAAQKISVRSKRSVDFWDESQCKDWDRTKDNIPVIKDGIREREEAPSDFLKRKKCTAYKFFGPKQAQANIRADIVNDLISTGSDPEYKMLAQFSVGSHFLGKDVDVGKMYMYQRKQNARAYINLFGRTLLDAARNNCDTTAGQPYRYSTFVPLYDFNVWMIQISLGLRFNGEMALNPISESCIDGRTSSKERAGLLLSPDASVRASGEASAKVMVVKGGVNVGGDFNYFSDLEFSPNPDLCVTAYTGHRPMNVSLQSWYTFWDLPCREWMERSTWKPNSLNWNINERARSPWIDNQCLLTSRSEPSSQVDP